MRVLLHQTASQSVENYMVLISDRPRASIGLNAVGGTSSPVPIWPTPECNTPYISSIRICCVTTQIHHFITCLVILADTPHDKIYKRKKSLFNGKYSLLHLFTLPRPDRLALIGRIQPTDLHESFFMCHCLKYLFSCHQ